MTADKVGEDSVLSRVATIPEAGCWLYTGHIGSNGYGILESGRKKVKAHRFFYTALVGPIPPNCMVCHKCDTRSCVNPDHLFIGKALENNRDAIQKGRSPLGSRVGTSKLTEEAVAEIRQLRAEGMRVRSIADRFGVSRYTIYMIGWGKLWSKSAPLPDDGQGA